MSIIPREPHPLEWKSWYAWYPIKLKNRWVWLIYVAVHYDNYHSKWLYKDVRE